ncbi:MAG: hypothetical protein LBR41_02200, partial [Rickettsiales bacterium]|nr:hypothetical protein [Rickettsiales bacterium]
MKPDKKNFGKRICVIGPSNSGKSTFSAKLAKILDYPLLHIDQIAHIPNTGWVRAPREETQSKHDEFIQQDTWVVDGQYKYLMPQRLERADTLVRINAGRFTCLWRYIKRCRQRNKHIGALEGATGGFHPRMVVWI